MGECATLPDLSCDEIPDYDRLLRQFCDMIERTERIPYDMLRPYPSMLFGLETAFAQLEAGGSTALFDTAFARGEVGIPTNGLVWMGSYEQMLERMQEKLDLGFKCIKLKIGAIDFDKEVELLHIIREAFPKEKVELRVDANGAFDPDDAMALLEILAKYDIHSIEQPIKQKQWRDMARLCKESPIAIALDEELIGVNLRSMKEMLLDTIQPQYIVLKPSLHGGMTGSQEWVELAKARGIGSWMTSALESNVGLNAIAHLAARTYDEPSPNMIDLIESGKIDYVVATSVKGRHPELGSVHIRRTAVERAIPCLTSMDTVSALLRCLEGDVKIENCEMIDINSI